MNNITENTTPRHSSTTGILFSAFAYNNTLMLYTHVKAYYIAC